MRASTVGSRRVLTSVLFVALVGACEARPDALDASANDASACVDPSCRGEDAGPDDAGSPIVLDDAGRRDDAGAIGVDAGDGGAIVELDASVSIDAGHLDASVARDAGIEPDAGTPTELDAGMPAPSRCDDVTPCAVGVCRAGLCYEETIVATDLPRIEHAIAGADADGTLRIVAAFGFGRDGYASPDEPAEAWEYAGTPGALRASRLAIPARAYDMESQGHQGTARWHYAYVVHPGRGDFPIVDGVLLPLAPYRRFTGIQVLHSTDGSRRIVTTDWLAGTTDVERRVWTQIGATWSHEILPRRSYARPPHYRRGPSEELQVLVVAGGAAQVQGLDGRALGGGPILTWDTSVGDDDPVFVEDGRGHTHCVVSLDMALSGTLVPRVVYFEVARDGTLARAIQVAGAGRREVHGALELDAEGHVYFLLESPQTTGTVLTLSSWLYRVAPDGEVVHTTLPPLEYRGPSTSRERDRRALAVRPNGDLTLITYGVLRSTELAILSRYR